MTPNAVAFYAVAVLIVLAAGAAVGLPSLRRAAYGGAAVIVLMAVLELISGAYALAVVQLVVPGNRGGCRRARAPARRVSRAHQCTSPSGALLDRRSDRGRDRGGAGGHPGGGGERVVSGESSRRPRRRSPTTPRWSPCCITARHTHWRSLSWWSSSPSAPRSSIGRRSADEQTLDQMLAQRRQREELAAWRRQDREQGRRRPARNDP